MGSSNRRAMGSAANFALIELTLGGKETTPDYIYTCGLRWQEWIKGITELQKTTTLLFYFLYILKVKKFSSIFL